MGISEAIWNSKAAGTRKQLELIGQRVSSRAEELIASNPKQSDIDKQLLMEKITGTSRFSGSYTKRTSASKPTKSVPSSSQPTSKSDGIISKLRRLGLSSINKKNLLGD